MTKRNLNARMITAFLAMAVLITPLAALAQTGTIQPPKNKYSVQDDIKLGDQAAAQVERQFPLINDADAEDYISRVGQRLVEGIPSNVRHPEFNYRFRWVNASDINAFALPGGPMYINRGMIENARNEGELAGVMAHELSHVALRHATAQATKQSSGTSTLRNLGLILGGAILGGQAGAQLGAVFAQGFALKYSREYETQADALGAQIMANAGYDPHDLANVFQTIASQSRGGGPEWLSSHPDPGNRYQKINQMADRMRIAPNPIKVTTGFSRTQERFRSMPRARSMSEIERTGGGGNTGGYNPGAGGRYSSRVEYPSTRMRTYNSGILSVNVPTNWRDLSGGDGIQFAPEGAYGDQGITHGVMIGMVQGRGGNLDSATQEYVNSILQGNSYLRQQNSYSRTYVGGRQGYVTILAGRSPITRQNEIVTVYTTVLRNGGLVYVDTVVPEYETGTYNNTFRTVVNSIRFND